MALFLDPNPLCAFSFMFCRVGRELPDELLLQTCSLNFIFVQLSSRIGIACHFVQADQIIRTPEKKKAIEFLVGLSGRLCYYFLPSSITAGSHGSCDRTWM